MNTNDTRQNAHKLIDRVLLHLLPALGMAERPEQVRLSHLMLDALLGGSIALCEAGTGIGKTYAYLVAGTAFLLVFAITQPILISTSSIALQNAVQNEYLPVLSAVLLSAGIIEQPMPSVIRKEKAHYVCPVRLEHRLGQLDLRKKNWKAGKALLSLREQLDMDAAAHLSGYDRERVCVPQTCDCGHENCRYLNFLDECSASGYPFQICNHNLFLADAIHRSTGRKSILRMPVPLSSTRPTSCRKQPAKCSAQPWRSETSGRPFTACARKSFCWQRIRWPSCPRRSFG